MPITIEALAAELAELRAIVSNPRKRKDKRRSLCLRLSHEEMALVDAAARDKGVCRSDLVRLALNNVLPVALPTERKIPPGFERMRVRYKPDRFDDGQTDHARNASAGRRALAAGLEREAALRSVDAAVRSPNEMLAQPATSKFSGKLSR